MEISINAPIKADSVSFTLSDGRYVEVSDSGEIRVWGGPKENRFPKEYILDLPSVEFVAEHCDSKDAMTGNGTVQIDVIHRH